MPVSLRQAACPIKKSLHCVMQSVQEIASEDQPPRKKFKAQRAKSGVSKVEATLPVLDASIQTLPVAGGPDRWSLKRFELWKEGHLCDCRLKCQDGTLIKASRLELSVWSEYFYRLLYRHQGEEITMEDVDPETLGTLVRAMFEKEITMVPAKAESLLALADRLEVRPVAEVVEKYLVSQINYENAIDALLLAARHKCKALRQAAIPLAATNFDRIDPSQLMLLTATDMKELLSSDQLSSTEEYTLFSIIKQWSSGPNAGSTTAEVDEQLLTLIGEIRLEHIMAEHLNSILDDSWLHQHPKVLSAVAKALVKKSEMSPTNRKNRVGQLVRFSSFSQKVEEAKKTVENSRQPIYSQNFKLTLPGTARHDSHVEDGYDWHVQVYPIGFPKYPNKVGIFLAGRQEENQENQNTLSHLKFRVTLINQHNPRESIAAEFSQPQVSNGGSLQFWGSQQFVEAADLQRGFLVDDTLSVSIVALHQSSKSAQKMPATGSKRAFALVDQTGNND